MPIETIAITPIQRNRVLEYEEGHFGDLKSIDIAPSKLSKSIAGFANADGGELYIGIDEDTANGQRKWRGFANIEQANGHIQVFLISDVPQQAHVVSLAGRKIGSPQKEVNHGDEYGAVSTRTLDDGVHGAIWQSRQMRGGTCRVALA